MINEKYAKKYCCEDISNIENYELAINDQTQTWDCHHRLQVTENGKVPTKMLIQQGLYYKRPASELIFVTHDEHMKIHHMGNQYTKGVEPWNKGKTGIYSAETIQKISAGHKGKPTWNKGKKMSDEARKNMSIAQKSYKHKCGFKRSNETKHILSELATIRNIGRVWVTNDIEDKFVNPDKIPEGFRRGRKFKSRKRK